MSNLPPLTKKIAPGAAGGNEFERLMNQLLLHHADAHRYEYVPVGGRGPDGGVDGVAPHGCAPDFTGPVVFQFKWLSGELHKGDNARQIKSALDAAVASRPDMRHWVLVTPLDLTGAEREWLEGLPHPEILQLHHWGQARIDHLLSAYPALLARYYPEEASRQLHWPGVIDFRQFEGDYRRQVAERHRYVKTVGLPPEALKENDARGELPLSKLFIPLRLSRDEGPGEISIAELINTSKSCVILGDPGTGKTTLLSFVTLLLAGEATLKDAAPARKLVPLHVSLRMLVQERKTGGGVSVQEYLARQARSDLSLSHARVEFYESMLAMGEAFVLFDGLDEVGSAAARDEMVDVIRSFRNRYPDCPVWVTSRIYGYRSGSRLPKNTFEHLRITPLNREEINGFIGNWYVLHRSSPRERDEGIRSLREATQRSRGVERLAGNPLLLTLMAFIHQGLGTLPQDRGELYDKCVELLLRTWQTAKTGEDSIKPLGLHLHTQRDYLAHLALHVQERRGRERDEEARGLFTETEALECLTKRHLKSLERTESGVTEALARDQMRQFLDYLHDRTGLLIDRGGGKLSFIHLTFQEYLAAWVFTCQPRVDNITFFTEHLGDPAWEEVLLLRLYVVLWAPGGGGNTTFDAIVDAMLERLKEDGAREGWLTLTRALRDNLEFAVGDRDVILGKAIDSWVANPHGDKEWLDALDEVMRFSEKGRKRTEELLEQGWMGAPVARAAACLHLHARLLSQVPPTAADKLRRRSDLGSLLPDLVAFLDDPGVAEILRDRAGIQTWRSGFDSADTPALYRRTLDWLTAPGGTTPSNAAVVAAVGWLWDKVQDEQRSRERFTEGRRDREEASLFDQNGTLWARQPWWEVRWPLGGFRRLPSVKACPFFRAIATQPLLARGWLGTRVDTGETLGTASEGWLVSKLRALLGQFEFGEARIARVIDHGKTLGRSFSYSLGRDFVRDFVRDFGRDFGRKFVWDFGRDFGPSFVRSFVREFGPAFVRDFVRDFGPKFVRQFYRDFGHEFGIDPEAPDWQDQWFRVIEKPENVKRVLGPFESDNEWWGYFLQQYESDLQIEQEQQLLHASASKPFAAWVALGVILDVALLNHHFVALRFLSAAGAETMSDQDLDKLLDDSLRRNPPEVALAGLAWEQLAGMYSRKHGRLAGPVGALMMAHASFAALMTGLPCNGDVWQKLVAERDMQDPLIQAGWHIHELCHFRDMEAHASVFAAILAHPPELLQPLYQGE